ncbi:transferase [Streptomyces sp. NPDC059698]|uniref:transferase n=1 Tax=unclassified Streptomyces TaxID=2593676 RepID=UPI000938D7AB|nr:transferase [Streptomyces sp. CB02366]OKJ35966.1 transferase [Streptomyces sp. CB02366]TVP34817.1 transferase [Streptomyces griseus subsp. griseus]
MSPTAVRADCAADPAGTLTFDLAAPAAAPAAASTLLLRRRGAAGAAPGGTVRIPLGSVGPGRLRAVLPASARLAEGRWDAYVEEPGVEGARTVEPGLRDLRALVDRAPDAGAPGVSARVPYPTADGRLALRCWARAPHAEAGAVLGGPDGMTVEGVLYGVAAGEGAAVEARLPGAPTRTHTVPLASPGGPAGTFAFTLPYAPPAAGPVPEAQLWQLWLIPAAGAAGVRISRILDDVWSRRRSFVYPSAQAAPGVVATPCYTADNDLCLRLEPAPAGR